MKAWILILISFAIFRVESLANPTNAVAWPSLAEVRKQWGDKTLEAIEQAGGKGNLTAQHFLGFCYAEGEKTSKDVKKALSWYEKAGAAGYAPSFNNIGVIYNKGELVRRDSVKAMQYFRRAADAGLPNSQFTLGTFYFEGSAVPRDYGEAFKWFSLAASQGYASAMYGLYMCYWGGKGVPKDLNQAMDWLKKSADAGYPEAQCVFGHYCEHPLDPHNPAKIVDAVHWYRLSAEQKHAGGLLHLGLCLLEGRGVESDEAAAIELIRQAADQGQTPAILELAWDYAHGIGEPRSEAERPIKLYERAAVKGSRDAFDPILFRYQYGVGTPRDLIKAADWYCRAALAGRSDFFLEDKLDVAPPKPRPMDAFFGAVDRSIILIQEPNGGQRETDDLLVVLSLYLKSAVRNDAAVALQLGEMYLKGIDAPVSTAKAWPWIKLASDQGSDAARTRLSEIESRLTAGELNACQRDFPAFTAQLAKVSQQFRGAAAN